MLWWTGRPNRPISRDEQHLALLRPPDRLDDHPVPLGAGQDGHPRREIAGGHVGRRALADHQLRPVQEENIHYSLTLTFFEVPNISIFDQHLVACL